MKITIQIDGEPKECALLLDALDNIGKEAQKRKLKMATVTTPCEVDTVPTSDLVHRPSNTYPYGTEVTTVTPLPPKGVTIAHCKESNAKGGDDE